MLKNKNNYIRDQKTYKNIIVILKVKGKVIRFFLQKVAKNCQKLTKWQKLQKLQNCKSSKSCQKL